MRVHHTLAAFAAIGALAYGVADPLHSAMAASSKASASSRAASSAAASAKEKVAVPHAARHQALIAAAKKTARPARTKTTKQTTKQTTKKATTTKSLADITTARDQHRASTRTTTPKVITLAEPSATTTKPVKKIKKVTTSRAGTPAKKARKVAPLTPRVYSTEESYGAAVNQRVTVTRLNTARGERPTVYFVHGGSWIAGGRSEWAAEANRWAAKGWTAVNLSYRLNVRGTLMLNDVQTVVSDFGSRPYVDSGRQIIVGASAGGHLATSVAVRHPGEFRGVIAWSPVISPEVAAESASSTMGSKVRLADAARRLWGSNWRAATPVSYVDGATPPLWAAAARGEWLRWNDQGELLCQAMGTRCTANLVPGRAHGAQLASTHAQLRQRALSWATAQVRS